MKAIFLALIMLIGFTSLAQQQTRQGHPQLTFKSTTYNFGKVKKGTDVVAVYSFSNTGDVPVIMRGVKPSCDCMTVISSPNKPIFPGEQQEIKIKYDSNKIGPISKDIRVETSELNNWRTLTLKGEVR